MQAEAAALAAATIEALPEAAQEPARAALDAIAADQAALVAGRAKTAQIRAQADELAAKVVAQWLAQIKRRQDEDEAITLILLAA